ncbi:MAG: ABC transporter permease [Puniceicoccales bacterium]|jgi:ABC-type transport system involved in multi-copper enzyme maturation permease subunit|nr:ABC transporter permease [Puniceicoccales bacterium]
MNREALQRVASLATNTFTEALRQRFFAFLMLLGVMLALSGILLRTFNFGTSELKFLADFGFGGVFLFGSILAVVMTVQLFFSELESRTALTLLARPVRRWEFFIGKFFGIQILLAVFIAVLIGVLGALLAMRSWELGREALRLGMPEPWFSTHGLLVFAFLQCLRLAIVSALTLFVCSFARTFLYAVVVSAMATLACQLQGIGDAALAQNKQETLLHLFVENCGRVIPDLQVFDLGAPLVLQREGLPATVVLGVIGYGLLYIPVLLLLGIWLFRDREI